MGCPLVIGAGPTGLTTALLLARHGVECRVIDRRPARTDRSKALLVNVRSLNLLASSGVSDQIREAGRELTGATIWQRDRRAAQVRFRSTDAPGAPPVVLPQATSERLLEAALLDSGVAVERGVKLVGLRSDRGTTECELRGANGTVESVCPTVVVGADGSRSSVREALGVTFSGSVYDRPFHLADVVLAETKLDRNDANILVLPDGGLMVIRIAGETWRVAGTVARPLERLCAAVGVGHVGERAWESTFDVAHRVADSMLVGRCALAGDAAHVHSPLGGRGMNLGIEDAYVLAKLIIENRLGEYDRLRRPIDRRVTRRVRRATDWARSPSAAATLARGVAPSLARVAMPFAGSRIRSWAFGLDHDVDVG